MQEVTFYNDGAIVVTNARFMVPSETYAMSGVTSIRAVETPPNRLGPVLFGLVGFAALYFGFSSSGPDQTGTIVGLGAGLLMFGLAIYLWMQAKSLHHVAVRTSAGERWGLSSTDEERVERIVAALNQSIVHRG